VSAILCRRAADASAADAAIEEAAYVWCRAIWIRAVVWNSDSEHETVKYFHEFA
jgi:hypothetical protein